MERAKNIASGIIYNAQAVSRILRLGTLRSDPVPDARDGEIVIYYGGWILAQLRTCSAGKQHMWQENWYEDIESKAEPGYYRVLLPVRRSNQKDWNEQLALLRTIDDAWQPAPVIVAATALLVHLAETGNDLLGNDWCRCAEKFPDSRRATFAVRKRRLNLNTDWDHLRGSNLWLAAAQKC